MLSPALAGTIIQRLSITQKDVLCRTMKNFSLRGNLDKMLIADQQGETQFCLDFLDMLRHGRLRNKQPMRRIDKTFLFGDSTENFKIM